MVQRTKDVVAAILIHNNRVLIAQRAKEDPLAGLWEFPGGKIEVGESPEEALVREMKEEFSINIEVKGFFERSLFDYPKGTIRLLAYFCNWSDGEIHSTVHQDYVWTAVEKLNEYTFAPADRPLVEKLRGEFIDKPEVYIRIND